MPDTQADLIRHLHDLQQQLVRLQELSKEKRHRYAREMMIPPVVELLLSSGAAPLSWEEKQERNLLLNQIAEVQELINGRLPNQNGLKLTKTLGRRPGILPNASRWRDLRGRKTLEKMAEECGCERKTIIRAEMGAKRLSDATFNLAASRLSQSRGQLITPDELKVPKS